MSLAYCVYAITVYSYTCTFIMMYRPTPLLLTCVSGWQPNSRRWIQDDAWRVASPIVSWSNIFGNLISGYCIPRQRFMCSGIGTHTDGREFDSNAVCSSVPAAVLSSQLIHACSGSAVDHRDLLFIVLNIDELKMLDDKKSKICRCSTILLIQAMSYIQIIYIYI